MIVPLISEDIWLHACANLPQGNLPLQPAVLIAPHPDDETLAAGGLIYALRQAGCEVIIIAVTDGENCYAGEDLRELRPPEQTRALARLGVDQEHIHRLHLPDSGLTQSEVVLEQALDALIPEGVHLIAPWEFDFHPDHEVCGRVARRIAQTKKLTLTSYLFWTWHRGTPDLLQQTKLFKLPLTPEQQAAKREALQFHHSQLVHSSGQPILPENLLAPAWRSFEVYVTQ